MTSARRITANQANAQKSTGPRTQTGKTKAAGNARRHGLTCAPPLELLRTWMRVILDTTEAPPLIDLKQTERGRLALNLAMAEAHLSVQNVRRLAEAEEPDPIYKWVELLEDDCAHFSFPKEAVRYPVRLRMREHKQSIARMARLHMRYTKEAISARNRAFRAWVAWLETNLTPEL